MWKLFNDEVTNFCHWYARAIRRGRPGFSKFHAILTDPPYHLASIVARFGKPGSAAAQHGRDGMYGRHSSGFMGQSWDGGEVAFEPRTWRLLANLLYPGGFILSFAGGRNYHRLATAMEQAGLLVHYPIHNYTSGADDLMPLYLGWAQGSGNAKGAVKLDLAVDKQAGAERPTVKIPFFQNEMYRYDGDNDRPWMRQAEQVGYHELPDPDAPQTELAKAWYGWAYGHMSIAPRLEPIVIAQVPYEGKKLDSILEYGAGAFNIDGTRLPLVEGEEIDIGYASSKRNGVNDLHEGWKRPWQDDGQYHGAKIDSAVSAANRKGRWPTSLTLTHHPACVADGLDIVENKSGSIKGDEPSPRYETVYSPDNNRPAFKRYGDENERELVVNWRCHPDCPVRKLDEQVGNGKRVSRYSFQADWALEVMAQLLGADPLMYIPKVSKAERNAGLGDLPDVLQNRVNAGGLERDPKWGPKITKNNHPTLKPILLNKWLATLLLPPDHYAPRRILIPFAGAMSEAIGAMLAGWDEIVAVEMGEQYAQIGYQRMSAFEEMARWGHDDPLLARQWMAEVLGGGEPELDDGYEQLDLFTAGGS